MHSKKIRKLNKDEIFELKREFNIKNKKILAFVNNFEKFEDAFSAKMEMKHLIDFNSFKIKEKNFMLKAINIASDYEIYKRW